ncbi:MAG: hypothetical protein J5695_07300 [Bacteroidales bacterium]|nr:hypothetical protein [Bacteroidales bacterium]MBO4567016.1 hypothetical protein [Bacteroidales bacterium]
MKKAFWLFFLFSALLSCRKPDVERFVNFDTFLPTVTSVSEVVEPDGSLNPEIRMPEDLSATTAARAHTTVARDILDAVTSNSLVHVSGTFTGHDFDGSPLTQSGKIIYPANGPIKNFILISHYTICADFEAPSESFPMEGILASKGYALFIADYIGYGVTVNRIHPYLHVESTARSVVDFALAAKAYMEKTGHKPLSDEVILVGYSQGASITLGAMNLIQKEYPEQLPIKKVYAGGGAYDLAATFDISMAEDKTGIPCAIPMLVQGINEGEGLGLDMKDFFQPRLLANYQEWINSKKYTIGQIGELMGSTALHELITDMGRDKTSPKTAAFYKALMINSTLDFEPQAPLMLFHCKKDEFVPYENALRAERRFKTHNIQFDFGDYGSHSTGALVFLGRVLDEL